MRRPSTLRMRFALWVALLLGGVLLMFGAFVYASMARGLANSLDASLRVSATEAVAAMDPEEGQVGLSDSLTASPATESLRRHGVTIRLLSPDGQVVQTTGPFGDVPVSADSLRLAQSQEMALTSASDPTGEPVRICTAPIIHGGSLVGFVQVAEGLAGVEAALDRLQAALLVGSPILVLVAALSGYFLAARALAPIDLIIRKAQRISAENLSQRLDLPSSDDEVGRLGETLDGMLTRLDESFRRERQFVADASHELRTPLAGLQTIVQVTRAERRAPEDYEQALSDLAEELNRLQSLAESLLLSARSRDSERTAQEPVDLSTMLEDLADSLRPSAEAKGLYLACDMPAGLSLIGDSDRLVRLFANLIDNAIKYTEHGGISIGAERADDGVVSVSISDTGQGIPTDQLPYIFDRFYRVDRSRSTPGTGLGLSIALGIAQAHGGAIEATSEVGRGTAFSVRLPAQGRRSGVDGAAPQSQTLAQSPPTPRRAACRRQTGESA